MKTYLYVSGTLFGAVGMLHLVRLIQGVPVQVGSFAVPAYASWLGAAAGFLLLAWAFRLICSVEPK